MGEPAKKRGPPTRYESAGEKAKADVARRRAVRQEDAQQRRDQIHAQYYQSQATLQTITASEVDEWSSYCSTDYDTEEDRSPSLIVQVPTELQLCGEQRKLVKLVMSGANVFYTGGAGTGKSTVLKAMVEQLREFKKCVEVVTPTGISAVNVGGSTYFTFAGWHPGVQKKSIEEIREMTWTKGRRDRIAKTEVLIIDEISMLEANQFKRLDRACRQAKGKEEAFGGMQVIVTGDFYQLPPVKAFQTCYECGTELAKEDLRCGKCGLTYNLDDQWAFRSDTWEECKFKYVCLKEIHRQIDPVFIDMLNTLRIGKALGDEQLELVRERGLDEAVIELSPIRKEVERKNREGFATLKASIHSYQCQDYAFIQEHHPSLTSKAAVDRDGVLAGCREHRLPAVLETKFGMPVILLANVDIDKGLVNGSQGKIIGYRPGTKVMDERSQQVRDLGTFTHLEEQQIGLWQQKQQDGFQVPMVEFENGKTQVILPLCQDMELGDPKPFSVIARTQIPLLPAWAITIHKSQGMTLERAVVDLRNIFEQQMAYVAMSRVKSLDGLRVIGKEKLKKDGVDEVVRGFMRDKVGEGM